LSVHYSSSHMFLQHTDHQDVDRGLAEIPVCAINRQNPRLAANGRLRTQSH
jgi:hypothetical protein